MGQPRRQPLARNQGGVVAVEASWVASLGHALVGVAAWQVARRRLGAGPSGWAGALGWAALALVPDLDVVAFRFGIPYAAPFGHRGATHSLAFAALLGLVVLAWTRRWSVGLLAAAVVASHPLLDMLTDGGQGVALWWPLSSARLFFPVRPLPVAPIGTRLASWRGARVLAVEAVVFAPLVWLASRLPHRTGRTVRRSPSPTPSP
jgi:inner membrane protein